MTEILNNEKRNDEIVYINMFDFFLKQDKTLLNNFIKFLRQRDISEDETKNVQINRGENNIDLIIRTKNYFIVIINDIERDKCSKTQLDKYYRYAEYIIGHNSEKLETDNFTRIDNNDLFKVTRYYIFTPNYNDINSLIINDKNNIYSIIKYNKLFDFFKNNKPKKLLNKKIDLYYDDFVNAIKLHACENDSIYEKM